MKLRMPRSVQDFNKSLAIDPTLFQVGVTSQNDVTHGKLKFTQCSIVYIQAYLARAAYYGMKGIYTKAILNCNEAIKLQPTSVRSYMYRCVEKNIPHVSEPVYSLLNSVMTLQGRAQVPHQGVRVGDPRFESCHQH